MSTADERGPEPDASSYPDGPASPAPAVEPQPRPADPERGLRGVMSAILVFEAVTILLGLTVIGNGGVSAPGWQIGVVAGLAVLHLALPAVMSKRFALPAIWILQALLIGCWAIHAAIGAMGIVFGAVWLLVMYMRREFRRRLAAGLLPSAAGQSAGRPEDPGPFGTPSRESR